MFAFILFIVASFSLFMYEIMLAYGEDGFYMTRQDDQEPFVSILIIVRNEEKGIVKLCDSLHNLTYPKKKFEILIGDDRSDDKTVDLLKKHKPSNAQLIQISSEGPYGKLNGLKQVVPMAKGDFLLFTDGDMIVNENWIQGMLFSKGKEHTITSGITTVRGKKVFDKLQNLDWLINQSLIAWISKYLQPVSVWGNNLIIHRESYEASGGFENMDPTMVEDVKLMSAIRNVDGQVRIAANKDSVCHTASCDTFMDLVHQRARWMKGAMSIPLFMQVGLIVRLLFLPAVLLLAFHNVWVLAFVLVKMVFIFFVVKRLVDRVKQPIPFIALPLFEFYEFALYMSALILLLSPTNIQWKGRNYQ